MERNAASGIPLCVDLDGTLLKTDSLWESVAQLLKSDPFKIVLLPLWTLRGKAFFKHELAERLSLNVTQLPHNEALVAFLKEEAAKGRAIVLVTGAPQSVAHAAAAYAGFFSDIHCSDPSRNLTGKRKAALLTERYGEKGFDYAGNAKVDLHVWQHARNAIVVSAPRGLEKRVSRMAVVERVFPHRAWGRALLRSIRPHQWLKNILIFVPVITSHGLTDIFTMERALLAFVAFCFCTSAVYLLNDLLDLTADRHHPRKRHRPLAAGDLHIGIALAAFPLLIIVALALSLFLPPPFLVTLAVYFVMTLSYSFYLKQIVIVDVLMLAGLYTVRILAGHAATGIPYSLWLLLFSLFFFFSLALIKRYSEIESLKRDAQENIAGRGYVIADREQVGILGSASGYIAALVLALYITSDAVVVLYSRPQVLWLLMPLMLYWISRIWLLAHRGLVHDDPVIFALKDTTSYIIGALIAIVLVLAT